jgi:hypothetical protein
MSAPYPKYTEADMATLKNLFSRLVEPQASVVPGSKTNGITATAVDGSGFDRVAHVIQLGSFGTSAGFDAEITESATSGGSYTLIASSGMTAVTASAANKVVLIDVPVNSAKPFQKIRSTAATAAIGVSVVALCYMGSGSKPTTAEDVAQSVYVA